MDRISRHASSQWRFLQLTIVIVAWMLVSPYVETRAGMHVAMHVLLFDLILVTIWANPQWRQAGKVIWVLWAISLLASTASMLEVLPQLVSIERTIDVALIAPVTIACIVGVLTFAFRAERPTVDGIFAMVVVYLLIAMVFTELYYMLLIWNDQALHLLKPIEQMTPRELRGELMYYSVITLSTVGYGDVLPVSPLARTLASIEALIGQFYVAVVVATFVAVYTTHSAAERAARRESARREE